ncbi:B12-binding domain-containing radical SAM protein [Synoicihabitans lomoniglobus]|uniref:Radical SAM protein n=1 Tax=Synoicihabitans lomoniglobus TaxID=2909285 RepID=A0AAF0CSS3_9BACT|nr:B12-binding domain-containing radical SAM protein [Opitutaceae bacterium LMO-M01]WED67368.1 radical SAM protein [Opitutaceae bacterium LMO-M01]
MKVCLINPPLISQKDDPHTGIIFMPFMLAYLSAFLKQQGHQVHVTDALGEAPAKYLPFEDRYIQGLSIQETVNKIPVDTEVVIIYFIGVAAHRAISDIAIEIRKRHPNTRLVLMENSQAVTAISLRHDAEAFLNLGYEVLLTGDPERPAAEMLKAWSNENDTPESAGLIFRKIDGNLSMMVKIQPDRDLDNLPFPDWKSFPLKNYWTIGYAHGPQESKYLPLLTSRGCPVPCRFCVIPATNQRKWRPRSAENVVDEMAHWQITLGVSEFHIEDVNPTVRNQRMVDISNEITRRKLKVKWKFASGTKIETMELDTIPILAAAGCNYISFSPETGSPELLKKINKPFKHDLAFEMVKLMHKHGIRSQACFVLGFPGETKEDVRLTKNYIKKLTKAGLDEIAQFIITPIPGSAIFDQYSGYDNYSQLTFSPKWRKDFAKLSQRRLLHYVSFAVWKCWYHPLKVCGNVKGILAGRFKTKLEQALYRVSIWRIRRLFGSFPRSLYGSTE